MPMTETQYRRMALALEGAIESAHMGHPDFRAHGRVFATLLNDRQRGALMLTPEQQRRFITASLAFTPAAGAGGAGGSTIVTIADVDQELLGEALTLAFQNAAARKAGSGKRARPSTRRTK
jgi:hypothetical protein